MSCVDREPNENHEFSREVAKSLDALSLHFSQEELQHSASCGTSMVSRHTGDHRGALCEYRLYV